MERIIALLREKIHYLEKFYAVNEHELINFGEGNFDQVEEFYKVRDKILDMVSSIDLIIVEENARVVIESLTEEIKNEVEALLKAKDEWVTSILAQDLQIISYIEKEKSNIIRELREVTQARRVVGAYARSEQMNQE